MERAKLRVLKMVRDIPDLNHSSFVAAYIRGYLTDGEVERVQIKGLIGRGTELKVFQTLLNTIDKSLAFFVKSDTFRNEFAVHV